MNKIILLALILVIASANTGVWMWSPLSAPQLKDLKSQGNDRIMIEILRSDTQESKISNDFLISFYNAHSAGISLVDAVAQIKGAIAPEEICNDFADFLPPTFDGIIWIVVWSQFYSGIPAKDRMPYLENIVKYCQQHGLKTGIMSDNYSWEGTFGSRDAGSKILSAVPVWYTNVNKADKKRNEANFDDWQTGAGFGPWKKPLMKFYENENRRSDGFQMNWNYYEGK